MWCFATATLNRRRWNFFLKTPAMRLWFAGIVTICRIGMDYDAESSRREYCHPTPPDTVRIRRSQMPAAPVLTAPALGQRRRDRPDLRRAGGSARPGGGAFDCKQLTVERW